MSLLKACEAAKRLGVSVSTLYALKDAGLLSPVRCGVSKGFRWSEQSLLAFLERRKEVPEELPPVQPAAIRLKHIKV